MVQPVGLGKHTRGAAECGLAQTRRHVTQLSGNALFRMYVHIIFTCHVFTRMPITRTNILD